MKNKSYAKTGAIICGLGNAFLNLMKQLNEMDQDPNLKFKWNELLGAAVKGATVGGVVGFGIGAIRDYKNSTEQPIDINAHLFSLSGLLMLDKSNPQFINLQKAVNKICMEFTKHFKDKISGELIPHGSTEKGTALHDSFDIDIAVPFYPKSFFNNEEMYDEVYKFFKKRIGVLGIFDVRKQKRSVGICVHVKGSEHWIDFAPYKLSKRNSSSGYLFVNKNGFLIDNSTIQKTDLTKLMKNKFSVMQKQIIVLLKDWKLRNDLPLPSHFIEYLVKDAYRVNRGRIPKSLEKKMIMILQHIANRLHIIHIKGNENTNNVISNSIDEYDKQIVIDACNKAIREYRYQPNSLAKTFG
ncbi:nucleotidyltransferase domain-containing protein [Imperialibacter roseus]|uniref:Nucleotidyltransferase domain-containing protein n=1 Tax=Imperialibacter roseus TaxID=1324217 RepID=A0ABZ0IVQ6_9BACT|nr:nucleotidyltransferase domain-containing protein [Imperialibacter roseus]WOK09138.1 nucleotidyltransferase domain-containing protein [Imperialibacter roseus]